MNRLPVSSSASASASASATPSPSARRLAISRAPLARRCGALLAAALTMRPTTVPAALLAATLLAGCAETSPQWDRHFGDITRGALAQQIIAPAAARNADPVSGVDGRAAAQAQLRYQKSLADPAPASSLVAGSGAAQ